MFLVNLIWIRTCFRPHPQAAIHPGPVIRNKINRNKKVEWLSGGGKGGVERVAKDVTKIKSEEPPSCCELKLLGLLMFLLSVTGEHKRRTPSQPSKPFRNTNILLGVTC